jgi:hypothetical protein
MRHVEMPNGDPLVIPLGWDAFIYRGHPYRCIHFETSTVVQPGELTGEQLLAAYLYNREVVEIPA